MPDVSVSLVNTNSRELLLACLETLPAQDANVEIVVLDNASEDGSADAVREHFPGVRVIEQRHRAGFGANHNTVIRATIGRYVFVLNEDTTSEDWGFERMVAHLDANPRVAALDLMNIQHQIQHLDVKPQNIFLVHQHVKVADFGLAKDLEGAKADLTGGITPTYAPPETFEGWVSRQSDQYSLAIVYMEMLTGRRPFTATNTRQMILQHMTAVPDLTPLPPNDRAAVGKALAKVPGERFATCADFVQAIRADETPPPPPPPPPPAPPPPPPTNLSEVLLHNLGAVVHGQDDVRNTSFRERLDLMQDHALVAKLHQGLGEGECLFKMLLVSHDGHRRRGFALRVSSCGGERTRGRRRVPKPPTRIKAAEDQH